MPTRTDEMTDEEIELRLALLERQRKRGAVTPTPAAAGGDGARLPPSTAAVAAAPDEPGVIRIVGRTKTPIEERWFRTLKTCPHCGEEKNVGKDFGVAVHRGVQYANSWCKECRSKTSNEYRNKPRKNASKNNPNPPAPKKPRAKR